LNSISVGIDMMPYFEAVCRVLVDVELDDLHLPGERARNLLQRGAIMRQGPHHSAQKSTTTGSADLRTSVSKVASETLLTDMATSRCSGKTEWEAFNR
jgi:hypothetical protein